MLFEIFSQTVMLLLVMSPGSYLDAKAIFVSRLRFTSQIQLVVLAFS